MDVEKVVGNLAVSRNNREAFTKLDVNTQLPEAVKKLKAVATDFSGSRAGFERLPIAGVARDPLSHDPSI